MNSIPLSQINNLSLNPSEEEKKLSLMPLSLMDNLNLDDIESGHTFRKPLNTFNSISTIKYKRLNRSYLKNALKMFWSEYPFIEVQKIIKEIIESDLNIPELHSLFTSLKGLSVDSTEGIILAGGFKYIDDIITVKYTKKSKYNYNLINEYNIGLILNKLRRVCPTFVYTYYHFQCETESSNIQVNDRLNICKDTHSGSPKEHLILEYINNSLPLSKALKILPLQDLKSILLALFCSLKLAQPYGYLHGDLHTENVLIRVLKYPITIKYSLPNMEDILITSKYVPVIIDYGWSRIKDGNTEIYRQDLHRYVLAFDKDLLKRYTPYLDYFKLICSISLSSDLNNEKLEFMHSCCEFMHNSDRERLGGIFSRYYSENSNINDIKNYYANQYNYPSEVSTNYDHQSMVIMLNRLIVSSNVKYIPNELTQQEFLANLYPSMNEVCNGEYGDIMFDDDGLYRSIFDCSKRYFDGRHQVIEFNNKIVLYQGDLENTYHGYEFSRDYYNENISLTLEEIENLKRGINVDLITDKMYKDNSVTWYYDMYDALSKSYKDRCEEKCVRAYRIKSSLVLLNMTDMYNILKVYKTITKKEVKLLYMVYHGYTFDFRYKNYDTLEKDINILLEGPSNARYNTLLSNFKMYENIFEESFFDKLQNSTSNTLLIDLYNSLQIGAVYDFNHQITLDKNTTYEYLNYLMFSDTNEWDFNRQYVLSKFKEWKKFNNRENITNDYFSNRIDSDLIKYFGVESRYLKMVFEEIMKYCKDNGYDGYCYPPSIDSYGVMMSGRVALGIKQYTSLSRDLDNPYDWQTSHGINVSGELGKLIEDMKEYKTLNVTTYAGNLIENSIWSALYINWMYKIEHELIRNIPNDNVKKCLIAASFLSEIGKAGDGVFIYYDKPVIKEVLDGYLDRNLYVTKKGSIIDFKIVLNEMGIPREYHKFTMFLIKNQYTFIRLFYNHYRDRNLIREFYQQFNTILLTGFSQLPPLEYRRTISSCIIALIAAKSMASRPYDINSSLSNYVNKSINLILNSSGSQLKIHKLLSSANEYIDIYPFILNRPRVYVGREIYTEEMNAKLIELEAGLT